MKNRPTTTIYGTHAMYAPNTFHQYERLKVRILLLGRNFKIILAYPGAAVSGQPVKIPSISNCSSG